MIVNTKYNIGDSVWVMHYNKPTEINIDGIEIFINSRYHYMKKGLHEVHYIDKDATGFMGGPTYFKEEDCFSTKEELINSLKDE